MSEEQISQRALSSKTLRATGLWPVAIVGWSLYTRETGWIPGERLSLLALRQTQTSLWDVTATRSLLRHFEFGCERMLPGEVPSDR